MTTDTDLIARLRLNDEYWSQEAADAITALRSQNAAKDARIAELEAAIKRQAGAARTIQATTAMIAQNENQRLRAIDRSEYNAAATVESEREANSILTDENDQLRAENERLREASDELRKEIASLRLTSQYRATLQRKAGE